MYILSQSQKNLKFVKDSITRLFKFKNAPRGKKSHINVKKAKFNFDPLLQIYENPRAGKAVLFTLS
jgi:hypothetical protein